MKTPAIAMIVAAVLFTPACPASAAEPTFDLTRQAEYSEGDALLVTVSESFSSSVTDDKQQAVKGYDHVRAAEMVHEIVKADRTGQPTEVLVTINSAALKARSGLPKAAAFDKSVAVRDIVLRIRKGEDGLYVDASTITSTSMKTLRASEIALLKRIFQDILDVYSRTDTLLMPTRPVEMGAKWQVAPEQLDAWSNVVKGRIKGKAVAASFKLDNVKDSTASISGQMTLSTVLGGIEVTPSYSIALRTNTANGHLLAKSSMLSLSATSGKLTMASKGKSQSVMVYRPGKARHATTPAKAFALGWPLPDKDNSSYRNPTVGVSLEVSRDFTLRKAEVAGWDGPAGSGIEVNLGSNERLADMKELLPLVQGNIKKVTRDYSPTETKEVTLKGGVPAALLEGTCEDGKTTLLSLIAIDGVRLVSVTATAPTDDADLIDKIRTILLTLRTSEPQAEEKPAK